jgi:PIN domain
VRRKTPSAPHKSVYWDACIWLAWLMEETRPTGEMEGTIVSVDHIHAGRCDLIYSRLIINQEVKGSRMRPDREALFLAFLKRPNVVRIDTEAPITALMGEIFDYYAVNPVGGKSMALQDALHLATAINKNVDAFYTFDSGKKGGLNLLALDGNVAGHPLHICRPPYEQAVIPFFRF